MTVLGRGSICRMGGFRARALRYVTKSCMSKLLSRLSTNRPLKATRVTRCRPPCCSAGRIAAARSPVRHRGLERPRLRLGQTLGDS